MTISVTIAGNSVNEYLRAVSRTEKLCVPGQEWQVELDFDCPLAIAPWDSIVIRENGVKVLTGYVASVSKTWGSDPAIAVLGVDTWKRATDCWNTQEYVTGPGDTAVGLICYFLEMAGLAYSIDTNWDLEVPSGIVISYQPVSEIITQLCAALNYFVRVDGDGKVIIGDVVQNAGTGPALAAGRNIITFDMMEGDYRSRNRVIVWGPTSVADVRSEEDWAVVDHTMVYASPYCYNARDLANAIWSNLHEVERVITIESPGDPRRRVGQEVNITAPDGIFRGKSRCTTIKADYDEQGYRMSSTFGERCAIYGSGPGWTDGRDVIVATYECGVWRCFDIWEDTPTWYPLNTGLQTNLTYEGTPLGSSFKCEWFIRDPFRHNIMAFLLTEIGLLRTMSLEPGYENWEVVILNYNVGVFWGAALNDNNWYLAKIRSTIAREGTYFVVVQNRLTERAYVGITDDRFATLHGGSLRSVEGKDRYGCYTPVGPGAVFPPGKKPPMFYSGLWGGCNYGHQLTASVGSWHGGRAGYTGKDGRGGLAAWHRNSRGCTVVGLASINASNAHQYYWHCTRGLDPYNPGDPMLFSPQTWGWQHPFFCYGDESPLSPLKWYTITYPTGAMIHEGYVPGSWLHIPTIHIPYDQTYYEASGYPSVLYFSPGKYAGTVQELTDCWPVKEDRDGVHIIELPWGSTPSLCPVMQGSIGTYTADSNYVYAFSNGKPSRLAVSSDGGKNWTEKGSVPFTTGCYSGFPRSEQKLYAGRHGVWDPSSDSDRALIYVSWDRGETWHDVTGDLWTKTQALNIREDPERPGQYLGTRGLVTIAPRY